MGIKKISKLHYITGKRTPEAIIEETKAFLSGGGDWVQLRMKESSDSEMLATARIIKGLCREYGATLIINDRVAIAEQIDADGVHLGKNDMETLKARQILGPDKIIGRTANTLEDILDILANGADYIGLGPYRFTTTKKNLSPVLGREGYASIFESLQEKELKTLPTVAIGGITLNDIPLLKDTGISGIAVSGAISADEHPEETTRSFIEAVAENFKKENL